MPTFSKIPKSAREIGAIAINQYAVFCEGIFKAGKVVTRLQKAEKKGMPACGYVSIKGEKIYYCRYGFVNDEDIYDK